MASNQIESNGTCAKCKLQFVSHWIYQIWNSFSMSSHPSCAHFDRILSILCSSMITIYLCEQSNYWIYPECETMSLSDSLYRCTHLSIICKCSILCVRRAYMNKFIRSDTDVPRPPHTKIIPTWNQSYIAFHRNRSFVVVVFIFSPFHSLRAMFVILLLMLIAQLAFFMPNKYFIFHQIDNVSNWPRNTWEEKNSNESPVYIRPLPTCSRRPDYGHLRRIMFAQIEPYITHISHCLQKKKNGKCTCRPAARKY